MARFDCAVWRPISGNQGGRISPNLGLILHHAVQNGSVWPTFEHGDVSAHFWVSQTGLIEQYVDSDVVAWHAMQLNSRYCGVETEGCASAANGYADPMSDAMVSGLGRLFAEGMRRHGWPALLANADGQSGFGYHRMAVATACPCDVRLNRRPDILAAAMGAAPGPPTPAKRKGRSMIAKTDTGDGYWTTTEDGAIYAFGDAEYKGAANDRDGGDTIQAGQTVVGIEGHGTDGYWLLISDGSVFAYGSAPYKGRPDRA